jgi:hypothetical protein
MKVKLLDENTYELLNDKGEQVQQGPVLEEWKQEARTLKKARVDVVAMKLNASVATTVERTSEVKGRAAQAPHEHPEYLSALPEHEHPYAPADHAHPHTHDEFAMFKAAIEAESQNRFQADKAMEAKYSVHVHPELAQAFHTHEDIYASLNVIRGMVTTVEASIPKEIQPHQHNDTADAISVLRSEITSLRGMVSSLETRLLEAVDKATWKLKADLEDSQPKGDYVTREEFGSLTKRKAEYVELSRQNVNGRNRITLEEA